MTDQLIDFAAVTPPDSARAIMRLSLLDWAACGVASAAEGAFSAFAARQTAPGRAGTFAGTRCAPAAAALVNGTLSHALDYDDTHFAHIGHPSVVCCSGALALAQERGADMAALVDAALVGAEASVAVGLWLGRDHYQVGFHQTATAGAFGATLAAARLIGLDRTQLRHALGLVATMASGLKSQFGTMGKPLNAGLAARAGVEAALWAEAGLTGPADGLDGPLGFGPTHHGAAVPDVALGGDWRMERVSHKFHACCHGLHASLEAVAQAPLAAAGRIEVFTHPRWLSVCNQPDPDTGLGAKFSYRHVMAMAAHGLDTGDIAQFTDAVAMRADLVAYRGRVSVTGDAAVGEMQARVLVDGVPFAHDLDAELPLQARTERIMKKARALMGARADDVWQAITGNDLPAFADQLDMS